MLGAQEITSKQVCSYVFMRIKHALMFSPLNAYFPFNYMYITVEKVSHTQSSLAFEDQQFLLVFRRWGGSEKKKSIHPSSANRLDTLCRTADLVGSVVSRTTDLEMRHQMLLQQLSRCSAKFGRQLPRRDRKPGLR